MYRIMFPLKLILLSISLLITSCMMNIDEDEMDFLSIEWLDIDYNQNDTTLFLQVEFIPVLLLITSCVIDLEEPIEDSLSIEWLTIDYNQAKNELFMHLEIVPGKEMIDTVIVEIVSENYDSTFVLNDNGIAGDLIAQNNRYSAITEINLPFQDYQFKAMVQTLSSQEFFQNVI